MNLDEDLEGDPRRPAMTSTRQHTAWGGCLVGLLMVAACTAADAGIGSGTDRPATAGSATAVPTGPTSGPTPGSDPSPSRKPVASVGTQDPVGAAGGRGLLIDAVPDGSGTTVRGFDRTTHSLVRSVRLDGRYGLPLVVPGDPAEGISHDGSVVVLAEASPTASSSSAAVSSAASSAASRFVVLDTALTRAPRLLELPPGFSYDAVSPDGAKLYLIEHLGAAASEHYQVRSYDLRAARLDEAVIADKTRVAEWMAGHPTSRVTSTDGSIVATMYERDGGEPFVHVLHAADGFAACIDLPEAAHGLLLTGSGSDAVLVLQQADGRARFRVDLEPAAVTPTSA
jgi:hypothetical protein